MRVTLTSIYIFNTIGYVSADFTTNTIYPDNIDKIVTTGTYYIASTNSNYDNNKRLL